MRDTVFISHATPEDNEFTIWLASRLEHFGYKVWIDKQELIGGETFWTNIESAINDNAVKFLLVYSNNICYKDSDGRIKNGIQKEIDFANKVIIENPRLEDFFIILNLDDASYDLFPGSGVLNHIHFHQNWAEGLTSLLKKLKRDNVPEFKNEASDKSSDWYLKHYLIKNPIIEKKELYYTNWWSVDSLPERFYITRFSNEAQASAIYKINKEYPFVLSANCLISFRNDLNLEIPDDLENKMLGGNLINPTDIFEIKVSELLLGYEKASFPSFTDAENYFKRLLKRVFHEFIRGKKMYWYEMANKNLAYYHTFTSLPLGKVMFKIPFQGQGNDKLKKKNLYGKYLDIGKWHYAISVKTSLSPFVGFHIKSHLIFSIAGYKAIDDKDLQHTYRRKKGKRMFNEEWRDLLLGFISSLKNENDQIILKTGADKELIIKNNLEMFWSDFGYLDPKDLDRQALFVQDEHPDLIEEPE